MIVLLGGSGYVGRAFQSLLAQRNVKVVAPTRQQMDYTDYRTLVEFLRAMKPEFLINAAGYTGKPNVDACETARADALLGNVTFPLTVSHACDVAGVPWGHVSSGCIYSGAIIQENNTRRIEADMTTPAMKRQLIEKRETIHGFTELDPPNFSFRQPPCSFYSGTKALGEEVLSQDPQVYQWRLRIPFDEVDSSRNYLSKLQRYAKVYDNVNSVSHLGDYVRACFELWLARAPFGVYNVTNPGFVTSSEVVRMIENVLQPDKTFEFWEDDREFYRLAAATPRSNCVLDSSKLTGCGIAMRSVEEAILQALENWQVERPLVNAG